MVSIVAVPLKRLLQDSRTVSPLKATLGFYNSGPFFEGHSRVP